MIHTDRAIVVEGKYDKIKLSGMIDGVIVCTGGFRIYKDKEMQAMLRHHRQSLAGFDEVVHLHLSCVKAMEVKFLQSLRRCQLDQLF